MSGLRNYLNRLGARVSCIGWLSGTEQEPAASVRPDPIIGNMLSCRTNGYISHGRRFIAHPQESGWLLCSHLYVPAAVSAAPGTFASKMEWRNIGSPRRIATHLDVASAIQAIRAAEEDLQQRQPHDAQTSAWRYADGLVGAAHSNIEEMAQRHGLTRPNP